MPSKTPTSMNRTEYLQMHRERRELIVAAVKAGGKTYDEIGEQFGVSRARISQIAAAAGITRKRGGVPQS